MSEVASGGQGAAPEGAPAAHLLLVLMNARAEREDEFNDWYDRHILEAIQLEGWRAAQRFRLAETNPEQEGTHRYLAVYEIDDLEAAQAALEAAREARDAQGNAPTAFLHTSDAKEPDKQMTWWTAIAPRRADPASAALDADL